MQTQVQHDNDGNSNLWLHIKQMHLSVRYIDFPFHEIYCTRLIAFPRYPLAKSLISNVQVALSFMYFHVW